MYSKKEVSFEEVPQLSERDKAYQRGDESLRQFYKYDVELETFNQVVKDRANHVVDRVSLVDELLKQYEVLDTSAATRANIESLADNNVYTLVTAHQPSLLTGPLYFIYKICSTIALCRQINDQQRDFKTVPVFILGGEDHDFEEIATAHIFGQNFTWETEQVGATGRMTTDGLDAVLNEVKSRLGSGDHADMLKTTIESARRNACTYGAFMLHFVNAMFREHGLVIANMDNATFKRRLLPYVLRDLETRDSESCVQKDQTRITEAGFKSQAHARTVNIFWMDRDRHRVIANDDGSFAIGEDTYTKTELIHLLESNPGSISPNVILRPVYQEVILPNLAYIGGGGELAYWLERKSLFEKWGLPFPMLIRRDSLKIVDKRTVKWLTGVGLDVMDLFQREEQVIGKYAHLQAAVDIDLSQERSSLTEVFDRLKSLATKIDPTLEKTVSSEATKAQKSLAYLESKMLKAEKNKNEVGINKLVKMKKKFFPGNDGLQERYDNFIPYYLRYGQGWIDTIIDNVDPMNKNFKILIEE